MWASIRLSASEMVRRVKQLLGGGTNLNGKDLAL